MKLLEKYYPVLLAFISFVLSVSLWFSGQKEEGDEKEEKGKSRNQQ